MSRKTLIGETPKRRNAETPKPADAKPSPKPSPAGRGEQRLGPTAYSLQSKVEVVPLRKIKRAAYNPRVTLQPGDAEYEKLARSLREFGLVDPPVWNKTTGNLIGGHQRLTVLENEYPSMSEIAVSVVELSAGQEKALNVALNKIGGRWDEDKLAALLEELTEEGADATATGFEISEIDALLAELAADEADQGPLDTVAQLGAMQYRVVVDCKDEKHQRQLLERFGKEKLVCRALMS